MTNNEFITDALRELGVIDAYQDPSAEDSALALRKLNALMLNLEGDTISLGYFPQTDVSADLPLSDADAAAVLPIFAMVLSINYPSAEVPPTLPAYADTCMSRLLRIAVGDKREASSMNHLPGGTQRGNILTGE